MVASKVQMMVKKSIIMRKAKWGSVKKVTRSKGNWTGQIGRYFAISWRLTTNCKLLAMFSLLCGGGVFKCHKFA